MKRIKFSWKKLWITALGDTAIAVLLWSLGASHGFANIFIVAQCIGFSCLAVSFLLDVLLPPPAYRWLHILIICVLGLPLSVWLAGLLGLPFLGRNWDAILHSAPHYLLISLAISYAYHRYYRNLEKVQALEQARREAELRGQKAALSAELRALQAQIEPHFLFNTLANLHSLIGRDDDAGRTLLEKLNEYLRATLAHSRAERATLNDEANMLSAYLAIQSQRMGGRLTWSVDIPPDLRTEAFAPMLLQPLVENAITHGIEPKLGDGELTIQASAVEGMLHLVVRDNGIGFNAQAPSGTGLTNVRERLAALFGSAARLELKNQTPSGVQAELWIPLAQPVQ